MLNRQRPLLNSQSNTSGYSSLGSPETVSTQFPWSENWLNKAYHDTLLPSSRWQIVAKQLCENLATKVTRHFRDAQRKNMMFLLLGEEFLRRYFPGEGLDVTFITPPMITLEQRSRLYSEAESWLRKQLNKAAQETRCTRLSMANLMGTELSDDMKTFLEQTNLIFYRSMEKDLALREAQWKLKEGQRSQRLVISHQNEQNADNNGPKLPRRVPLTAISSIASIENDRNLEDGLTANVNGYEAAPPLYSSCHSEHIGDSIVSILRAEPKRFLEVAIQMSGRRLPQSLRRYMWKDSLLRLERERSDNPGVERVLRDQFGKAVARGISQLRIQRATQSPINALLENYILESYERIPALKDHSHPAHVTETLRTLNILYVHNRSYEPHQILWLFPLQIAFQSDLGDADMAEHVFELAMYLDQLNKGTYPAWSDIFKMAEQTLILLQEIDSPLLTHLRQIAQIDIKVNPKEFMVQLIHQEREKGLALQNAAPGPKLAAMTAELLSDPIVFLRKWIGEGFVGVLSVQASLFLWDQLIMEHFAPTVFQDMALSLLLLLRDEFFASSNYTSMKNVFLQCPSKLYTTDIIRAWVWIHRGRDPTDVPTFNRLKSQRTFLETALSSYVETPELPQEPQILNPLGVNHISLTLLFSLNQRPFVTELRNSQLTLHFSLMFGDVKLKKLMSQSQPSLSLNVNKKSQQIEVTAIFPTEEVFIFDNVDIGVFDIERELNSFPYLTVEVHYASEPKPKSIEKVLGWARMATFVKEENNPKVEVTQYIVDSVRDSCPLNPGRIPADVLGWQIPDTYPENALLKKGSIIGLHFYPGDKVSSPRPEIILPRDSEPSPTPATQVRQVPQPSKPIDSKSPPPEKEELPPPSPCDDHWVPYKPRAAEKVFPSTPCTTSDAFDLYVDQIRFLPDDATIVKVTGRFVNSDMDAAIDDLLLYPNVQSIPRSPQFLETTRQVINNNEKKRLTLSTNSLVLLRVYTVSKRSLEIVIVGNCIFKIFSDNGNLRTGGFQMRLRNSPSANGLVQNQNLTASTMDNFPSIPCTSILVRLLPHTTDVQLKPNYRDCVYDSFDAKPSVYESEIMDLYSRDPDFPNHYHDMVKDIVLRDGKRLNEAISHNYMINFLPPRLTLLQGMVPKQMHNKLVFHYRLEKGFGIKVERAYGLTNNCLVFAVAKIFPGQKAAKMEPNNGKKYGLDQMVIVNQLEAGSFLESPQWRDKMTYMRPYQDPNSILIVQFFGVDAVYKDGNFLTRNGEQPILRKENLIGWTAITVFQLDFVNAGRFHLPIFQTRLHPALMKRFQSESIQNVLQIEKEFHDVDADSVIISIMDGHEASDSLPKDIVTNTSLIDCIPEKKAAYISALNPTKGPTVRDVFISGLPDQIQKLGKNSSGYKAEEERFVSAFQTLTEDLVSKVPKRRDYLPLFL